jgi:choline dehydrogenase-like flavoprotein
VSVLLLEAGGRDNYHWIHIPVGYLYTMNNPRTDWCFSTEAEEGLNGRALNYPRGKVLGGCSSINGMIYMRGQARDYDQWRQFGNTGWGWDDVLPYFLKSEDQAAVPADEELHHARADDGPAYLTILIVGHLDEHGPFPKLADVLFESRSDIMFTGSPHPHFHHLRRQPIGALCVAVELQHFPASVPYGVDHFRWDVSERHCVCEPGSSS